jgi:hypothetical protein
MKRSTLILLVVAIALGAFVYFYEIKGGKARDEETALGKPAFTFKREDLASITLTRGGQTVALENQNGKWVITQPVSAPADSSAIDSLVNQITEARVERTIAASAEEVKSFGLAEPAVTIEIKLKSGEQHSLKLGSKDFSGLSVYGRVDGAQDVAILPVALLTSSDKSLNDLRDRAVLGVSQYDITGLSLSNENGHLTLAKQDANWVIKSPVEAAADEGEINSLLSEATTARAAEIASETADDLARYGLDKPRITLTAQLQGGGERTLIIGPKTNDSYFAKNSALPQIFKIDSALYDKLNVKLSDLRDKQIIKLSKDELTRVEIKNTNQTLVAEKDKDGKWIVKEPAEQKDKEAQSWKLFDPLETTRATEVLDKATGAVAAKLAKPAIEVRLTDKNGKVTVVKISAADGEDAYASVEGRPAVYKVSKHIVDDLNFKAADIVL